MRFNPSSATYVPAGTKKTRLNPLDNLTIPDPIDFVKNYDKIVHRRLCYKGLSDKNGVRAGMRAIWWHI